MNDLDLLVKREDAIRLRKALLKNGFESAPMMSPLHEKILPYYGKHLPEMVKNGLAVEIHFRLFDQKEEQLTRRVLETAIYDEKLNAFIPDQELHFLYLIKHLNSHEIKGSSQLRLYTDLVVTLENGSKDSISFKLLVQAASKSLKLSVNEKFFVLGNFFGGDLKPKEPMLLTGTPETYIEKFIFHLGNPRFHDPDQKSEDLLKPLKGFKSVRENFYFITGYIFPSISFMKYRYKVKSKFRAITYYPVRLRRLLELVFSQKSSTSDEHSKK
jgi:hypothetical protein